MGAAKDIMEVGKYILKTGGGEAAKSVAKETVAAAMKGESPWGDTDVVQSIAGTAAKAAGLGDGDMWSKALGLAKNYMDTVGGPVRQSVLEGLTTTAKESGRASREGYKDWAQNPGVPRFKDERSVGDPYEVTEGGKWKGWDQRYKKDNYRPDWVTEGSPIDKAIGSLYDNPERVADMAGTATAAGTAILGGSALNWWAEGSKPRSSYAAPVEPHRGGYNPSVESARMAASYRHDLEEQKFAHKMALMDAREQARVPGSQNTSVGAYGSGNVQGLLGQLQSSRPSYF